eukprot:5214197-Pyramimonas_sp.AAC.3
MKHVMYTKQEFWYLHSRHRKGGFVKPRGPGVCTDIAPPPRNGTVRGTGCVHVLCVVVLLPLILTESPFFSSAVTWLVVTSKPAYTYDREQYGQPSPRIPIRVKFNKAAKGFVRLRSGGSARTTRG